MQKTYIHTFDFDGIRYVCWMELLGHAYRNMDGKKSYNGYF